MAVDTQSVGFLSVPLTGAPAMDACLPVPENGAVTLAAEVIGLLETHEPAAGQPQDIPIIGVVAIQAPPFFLVVVDDLDLLVHILQDTALGIDFLVFVAV